MIARLAVATFALASTLGLAAAACSSSGERTESASEALRPKCGPGQTLDCSDLGPTGNVLCTCVASNDPQPFTIDQVTSPASPGVGCGSNTIAAPFALASAGCTLGLKIGDNAVVYACDQTKLPPWNDPFWTTPIGRVNPTMGSCSTASGPIGAVGTCEETVTASSLYSSCVGAPRAGWTFVVDALSHVVITDGVDAGDGGVPKGCPDGCPSVSSLPPLAR